jgi:hypothetical protein
MKYERYTAKGKSRDQLMDDYEGGHINAHQGGNTIEYLHAALMSRAADEQRLWAIVGASAACFSVVISVVALLVSVGVI